MERDSDESLTVDIDDLSLEAQNVLIAESRRTGEPVEQVLNRLAIKMGRKLFPDAPYTGS